MALTDVLEGFDIQTEDGEAFYDFVEDIAKNYNRLQDDEKFHLTRQQVLLNSITSKFNSMPAVEQPFDGSTEAALMELLPVIEKAFDMPAIRPPRGNTYVLMNLCLCPNAN